MTKEEKATIKLLKGELKNYEYQMIVGVRTANAVYSRAFVILKKLNKKGLIVIKEA